MTNYLPNQYTSKVNVRGTIMKGLSVLTLNTQDVKLLSVATGTDPWSTNFVSLTTIKSSNIEKILLECEYKILFEKDCTGFIKPT